MLTEYGLASRRSAQPQSAGRAMLGVAISMLVMLMVFASKVGRRAPEPRIGRRFALVELIQVEQVRNAQLAQQILQLRSSLRS